jgi:sec-independent protein translocase protein TatA
MGSFGGIEWLVIILVVLLLFGAKKIPELARGLGQGLTEFRKASSDIKKEIEKGAEEPTRKEWEQPKRTQKEEVPSGEVKKEEVKSEKESDD